MKRHIFAELAESKGIWVFKQDDSATNYRKNGHAATLGDPGRNNRYRTPKRILATLKARGTKPSILLPSILAHGPEHVGRYYFEYVAVSILGLSFANFSKGFTPYENEAHHLIPQAQFLALFGEREAAMLKRVDYNVHNGRNLIFLPGTLKGCDFHNLPYHLGSHPTYDTHVANDARQLSNELKELSDDACTEEVLINIKERLMSLQEKYWKLLANAGARTVNDSV
ncbi:MULTISPECIES: AHH domain-containing protein [Myxococcus]|uniref:Uncharacterized protein n=1 Tax=Myxococcus llanfairpwllgwyngyllgogerychwyrndrobwllllantysiliogogogochensis TaxID=2590453 RepID=A0A540X875_9BACT|nr:MULTISPECIES: AHH domain-containing protein [Myxococcus]NTX08785.1 AHH domain-containing protein [Myxococcus sp. CA040A]TQF17506.1 hypothetical protein FJV41_02545 [Myxococcus llanfairpwllgwyngyllgogerychwyrndrobwllllantysiliogogogochensis]